jgi:hypothetical protein
MEHTKNMLLLVLGFKGGQKRPGCRELGNSMALVRSVPALHPLVSRGRKRGKGGPASPKKLKWPVGEARARRSSQSERSRVVAVQFEQRARRGRRKYTWTLVLHNASASWPNKPIFSLARTAQTHVAIGFSGKIAFCGTAQNYQYVKILAGRDREV